MAPPQNLRATGDRIERLLDELRVAVDPRSYQLAEDLLRAVTDLYGGGLARVVELVGDADPGVMARLVDDELVASLLLVHGLHPRPVTARVDAGAVLLRLLGSCDGCPSSPVTLQHAVEQAIFEAAPEITTIDVEEPRTPSTSVPVALGRKPVYESCPSEVLA